MKTQDPYQVIKHRYVTEKANVLLHLKEAKSNRSLAKYELPKYVFIVDQRANKIEIKTAIEKIYSKKKVKVVAVNTIQTKPKKRRFRGHMGQMKAFKKAVVTLRKGDNLDEE